MQTVLSAVGTVEQDAGVNTAQVIYLALLMLLVFLFSMLVIRIFMGSKQRNRAMELNERAVELLESIDRKLGDDQTSNTK